uniref:Protein kinase domain-containing protein n=1 Tax=Macrostomum lignano TaxID=282301 RepID=A0A1I8ILW2_9PLAT
LEHAVVTGLRLTAPICTLLPKFAHEVKAVAEPLVACRVPLTRILISGVCLSYTEAMWVQPLAVSVGPENMSFASGYKTTNEVDGAVRVLHRDVLLQVEMAAVRDRIASPSGVAHGPEGDEAELVQGAPRLAVGVVRQTGGLEAVRHVADACAVAPGDAGTTELRAQEGAHAGARGRQRVLRSLRHHAAAERDAAVQLGVRTEAEKQAEKQRQKQKHCCFGISTRSTEPGNLAPPNCIKPYSGAASESSAAGFSNRHSPVMYSSASRAASVAGGSSVHHSPGCQAASSQTNFTKRQQHQQLQQYSTSLQADAGQSQHHQHRVCELTIAGLKAALADAEHAVGRRSAARTEEIRQLTFELRGVQARLAASQADEARMREERRKLSDRARAEAAEAADAGRELRTSLTDLQSDKAELLAGLEALSELDWLRCRRRPRQLSALRQLRQRLGAAAASVEERVELTEQLRQRRRVMEARDAAQSLFSKLFFSLARCVELTEQLRMTERRAESLMEARDAAQESLEKCRSYQSQRDRDYQAALDATAALEESLSVQQASVARLSSHSAELERQKLQLADACVRWSDQHAETQAALDTAESRIQQLSAERDQLKSRLDDLTDAWDEVGVAAFAFAASVGNWGVRGEVETGYGARARLQSELRESQAEAATWRASCLQLEEERRGLEHRRETLEIERTRLQTELAELRSELQNRETATSRLAWEKEQRKTIVYLLLFNARSRLDQCMAENARLRDLLRKGQQSSSRMAIEFGSNTSGFSETTVSETILEEKNRHIQRLLAQISRLTSVLKSTSSLGGSASELHQQSLSDSRPATPSPKFAASSEAVSAAAAVTSSASSVVGWRGSQAEHLRTRVLQALVEALQAELSLKEDLSQLIADLPADWQATLTRRVTELADLRRRLGDVLSDIELAARRLRDRGGELAAQLHRLERENAGLRDRLRTGGGSAGISAPLTRRRSVGPTTESTDLLLHAVCRLDDFELLRKESRENLEKYAAPKIESLGVLERSQSVDYSLLKHLARELAGIQFYAEERERLLNKFWICELPPWAVHSRQARYYHQYLHQGSAKPNLEAERWKGRYAALKEMLEQRLSSDEARSVFNENFSGAETLLSVARHNLEPASSPAESAYTVHF